MFRTRFAPIARRFSRAAGGALLASGLALSALVAPVAADTPTVQFRTAPYQLSVSNVSALEGNSGQNLARFTVTLQRPAFPFVPPPGQVFVQYNTISGTATSGSDFVATSGSLLFDPVLPFDGSATKQVVVPINGDLLDENDESFTLRLFNPTDNAELADPEGLGTIHDDDPLPRISIASDSALEGHDLVNLNQLRFTVSLDHPVGEVVIVDYATSDGTARAGIDYVAGADNLFFAPGQTSKTVTISIRGDRIVEGNETLLLRLSNPRNATLADASAQGIIRDDDQAQLSISNASLPEPNVVDPRFGLGQMTFTVSLSEPVGEEVRVSHITENGTAVAGNDYVTQEGVVIIPAGETSARIRISIQPDSLDEPNETFFVTLANAVNAGLADDQGVGTIIDND